MLFDSYKSGDPFGLTTYKDGKRTRFITQFAYSGNKGEDAFILVNQNNRSNSTNIAKTLEIMSNDNLSFKEKMNIIRDEGYSGVIQLKAINRQNINIDTNDPFHNITNIDGSKGYSYDTIEIGNKGYQKISQKKLTFWDHDSDDLSDLEINITNDADIQSANYRKVRKEFVKIMDAENLSETEKNTRISKMFTRANNNILSEMPGPSGYQTLKVNGKYQKILVPNISDIMQSQQLAIQPLELLALQTAKQDVLLNSNVGAISVARNFIRLAGLDTNDTVKQLDRMIAKVKNGETISEEFNEYFLKHLIDIPMGLEENFTIEGIEANMSIIDYLHSRQNLGKGYHKNTKQVVNWLFDNKDRLSQFIKETATGDKKISLIQTLAFNQYAFFDSNIRPPANQQQTAKHFIVDEVKESLKDVIDKLQLQIGYDVQTLQRAELVEAIKDVNIADDIKYGNLQDGITANFRQMNPAEVIDLFKQTENKFDEIFESIYKDSASKFGISEAESKYLLQQAFDVMKNRSANIYESKGIARASFANNSLFTDPEIKTVEFNLIEDTDLEYLKTKNKEYAKAVKNNFLEQGTKFKLANGDVRIYHGPSGIIEDLDTLLTTGKGHLIEAIKDPTTGKINPIAGMNSIKFFLGNEKGTLYTPEFNSNTGETFIKTFKNFGTAQNAYMHYMDAVFGKIFGDDISAVFDLSTLKHRSNSITYGSYMNRMFYNVNKYIQNYNDENIFTELENIFWDADNDGIRIARYKGQSVIDPTQLGTHGAFNQIDEVIKTLRLRAEDSSDKYQNVWKKIIEQIDRDDRLNTFRFAINRGINNESMGGAMNLDPRMELSLRSQFQENIDDYITVKNGRKVNSFDYIADYIRDESIKGLKDTSKTPIDAAYHLKRNSALKTVQGIELSTQYINTPEALPNSNVVLDIDLKDITLASPGSNADEISKTSIYKMMDSDGAHYSEFLREAAKKNNKNIDDIVALRINMGNGIAFDRFDGNAKKVNQLIVPLYDLTPFKGTVQYENRVRDLNNAISVLKNYGQNTGIRQSGEELNKAVQRLYTTMVQDLNYEYKKSYVASKILKVPMKNSGMLSAESSIVPTVNGITDNYQNWIANPDKKLLEAIQRGDVSYATDLSVTGITGRKYTTVINNTRYYDDIVEMGKEGFIQKGVDFRQTGADIFFNKDSYKNLIKGTDTSFLDLIRAKQIIDKGIDEDEVLIALTNYDSYERLLNDLAHKKQYLRSYRNEIAEEMFGTSFLDLTDEESKEIIELAKEHFAKLEKQAGIINKEFENLAEKYLSEVGTYGIAARYPTFFKDSVGPVIFRLNKSLQRDEMLVSGVFGHKLNMDHDGDNGVVKLMLDDKGIVLNKTSNPFLYKAFSKAYELRVYNLRNNKILSELIEDMTPKQLSDLTHGNVHIKREMLAKEMNISTRNELLTELKLDHLVNKSVDDYTQDEVLTVFKGWNNKYGNMINNVANKATSIKARLKNQIGTISNANYAVNQVMYESLNQAIQQNDTAAINAYKNIITDLHLGNMGLLPLTEQKGIDVKHSYQGFTITEASKYTRGIKKLFEAKTDDEFAFGRQLITEAMGDKFTDDKNWSSYLSSITKLAKDTRARQNYKALKVSNNLNTAIEALKFMENVSEYRDYLDKNNSTANTAVRVILDTFEQLENRFTMGYYHDNVMQTLHQDAVYISTQDGKPVLYRVHGNVKSQNGKYTIDFDTFDLNKDDIVKGKPNWISNAEVLEGTAKEIQAKLQNKFGDFRSYSLAEIVSDVNSFKKQIRKETVDINVNKFANMYSRGNTKMANKFLDVLKKDVTTNSKSITGINEYLNFVKEVDFTDFINKLKFIKSDKKLQNVGAFENETIDDILTNINKRIIEKGKNKKTKTSASEIFNNELLRLANDMVDFNTNRYQSFVDKNQETLTNAFKGYEEKIYDIQKINRELSEFTEATEAVNKIIQEYKEENAKYIKSLNINPATIYEMDTMFGWNSNDLKNMRVGINTENGLYGRRFSDLSESDIDEILRYSNREKDPLLQHAYDTTKSNLIKYKETHKISNSNGLKGLPEDVINNIRDLNEDIRRKASEAAQEGANAKGKKIAKEYASDLVQKTLDKGKEFIKTTPGKVVMGLAALGLVSNILSSGDDKSPLSPELKHKDSTGPINNGGASKAPASNTGKKTVYVDSNSGLEFKMSAKSKRKINQMNAARQLAAQTSGDTNINIYDDRSQVSNNWLERKFSELV